MLVRIQDFQALLVLTGAGSGTILDVLRIGKPLIVIPNPTLLDDHQTELAVSLQELGHLKASTVGCGYTGHTTIHELTTSAGI
jgi:UDP-N-acetylglucosamine transferase subunit ALG13